MADPQRFVAGRDDNPAGRGRSRTQVPPEREQLASSADGVILRGESRHDQYLHAYLLDEYYLVQHLIDHDQS